jgi:hypothetical protein
MLGLDGTVFSQTLVNISSTATTSLPTPSHTKSPKHGLSTGGKVGVAITVLLVVMAIIGFAFVSCRRRFRSRSWAENQGRALADAGQLPDEYRDNGPNFPASAYPPTQQRYFDALQQYQNASHNPQDHADQDQIGPVLTAGDYYDMQELRAKQMREASAGKKPEGLEVGTEGLDGGPPMPTYANESVDNSPVSPMRYHYPKEFN